MYDEIRKTLEDMRYEARNTILRSLGLPVVRKEVPGITNSVKIIVTNPKGCCARIELGVATYYQGSTSIFGTRSGLFLAPEVEAMIQNLEAEIEKEHERLLEKAFAEREK